MAERLGTTRNTVARWERNEMEMREPVSRLVKLIAKAKGGKP
jgi:DNA-binding transcriptional regulator YiaG